MQSACRDEAGSTAGTELDLKHRSSCKALNGCHPEYLDLHTARLNTV